MMIDIHRKRRNFFSIIYPVTFIFQHQSGHKYGEPEILNTLRYIYLNTLYFKYLYF